MEPSGLMTLRFLKAEVSLPVDLGEGPIAVGPGVLGVFELTVHACFETERSEEMRK